MIFPAVGITAECLGDNFSFLFMHLESTFILHDATIALFDAWKDGMPKRGPSELRGGMVPLLQCKGSISWSQPTTAADPAFGDHRAAGDLRGGDYAIRCSFLDGVVMDQLGHALRTRNHTGRYVLVVVYFCKESKQWQRYQFYHVQIQQGEHESGDGNTSVSGQLSFIAGLLEYDGSEGTQPLCVPHVLGRVDWVHGGQRIPCLTYDPLINVWAQTTYSDTGLVNQPYAMFDAPNVDPAQPQWHTFSLMQPRVKKIIPTSTVMRVTGTFSPDCNGDYYLNGEVPSMPGLPFYSMENLPYNEFMSMSSISFNGSFWVISHNDPFGDVDGVWIGYDSPYPATPNLITAWNPDGAEEGYPVLQVVEVQSLSGARLEVVWQQRLYFSVKPIGSLDNELKIHEGIVIECNGSPECIEAIDQDELLDEPLVQFRVLDRVYATLAHDRIAVPALHPDEWPVSTDLFFRIGNTILDDRGWWNLPADTPFVTGP